MRKTHQTPKPIAIKPEIIRVLARLDLPLVVGGLMRRGGSGGTCPTDNGC